MADYGLAQVQSLDDLDRLVQLAVEVDAMHIVFSVAKIVQPRFKPMSPTMKNLKQCYERLAYPNKLVFRGGSWRLPDDVAREHVAEPLLSISRKHGIRAVFCKQNLVETP